MMGHYTTRARTGTFPGFDLKTFQYQPPWDGDTYMVTGSESRATGMLFPGFVAPARAGVR